MPTFLKIISHLFILDHLQCDQEHENSTSTQASFLGVLLGKENVRRLSEVTDHVQTKSSSDQCFFCLLLLVMCCMC